MKNKFLFIILNASFIFHSFCFSQNRTIDSLLTLLKTDKADTNKVKHLNELGWALMYQNPDTSIILGNQALAIITPIPSLEFSMNKEVEGSEGIRSLLATTLGNQGVYYYFKADYLRALDYYLKELKIEEELKNKKGILRCLGNIGIVYCIKGDYPKALDYLFKTLSIAEELGDKNLIAPQLCNIGNIYTQQNDYPKALNYFFKAIKMAEKLGDKNGIAIQLGNIGNIYTRQGDYPKALDCFFKALKIAEKLGDKSGIARYLGNIGGCLL